MVKVTGLEDWELLKDALRGLAAPHGLAVALSGGLDSRFIAHAALAANCDVIALHARGFHIPARETAHAEEWARQRGLPLQVLEVDIMELHGVSDNSRDRCYHCKRHLMEVFLAHAGQRVLCDGTNADDLGMYRPGLRALEETGVRSPLVDAGIGKARVRELGRLTGLEDPGQAARPCLMTRLPYGAHVEPTLLQRIADAEAALEDLGLREFRLRLMPEPMLHTVPIPEHLMASALKTLEQWGFSNPRVQVDTSVGGYFDR